MDKRSVGDRENWGVARAVSSGSSVAWVAWIAVLAAGCGSGNPSGSEPPACLPKAADASCTAALYGLHGGQITPTFEEVFSNTLQKSCRLAGCHTVRLETAGQPWSMPRGGHLDDQTLCAIRHFIANGAPR